MSRNNRVQVYAGMLLCLLMLSLASVSRAQYRVSRYTTELAKQGGSGARYITAHLVTNGGKDGKHTSFILKETFTPVASGAKLVVRFASLVRPAATFNVTSYRAIRPSERYRVEVIPITVQLIGTTLDKGTRKVLTGQQVNPALVSPIGVKQSTDGKPMIRWEVKGKGVFKNYPWNHPQCRVEHHAASDWNAPSPGFFTSAAGRVTISCTATLDLPRGALVKAPLPQVTVAAETLHSIKPIVSQWDIASGATQEIKDKDGRIVGFGLTGIMETSERMVGQRWTDVHIDVPAPFAVGIACFAQILTPDHKAERNVAPNLPAATVYEKFNNGLPGLDRTFPYVQLKHSSLLLPFDRNNAKSDYTWYPPNENTPMGDAPEQGNLISDVDAGGDDWRRITASDTATTWLMYRPLMQDGQPTTFVPLMDYSWRWSGTMVKNTTGQWELTERFPATHKQSAITKEKQPTDTHPEWERTHDLNPWLHPTVKR